MHRIPAQRAHLYFGIFFLSGVTLAIGSLAPYIPSGFSFLYLLFPVDSWVFYSPDSEGPSLSVARLVGVAIGAMFAMYYMLGRYGIRGMALSGRPWRFGVFLLIWAVSLIGGFRSFMLLSAMLFMVQFFLEGLHKTRLLLVFLVAGLATFAVLLPFAAQLPYSFQRALSIFQIPVSPEVELDTHNSNEWRLRMWGKVAPQIPHYLLLGKGFGINVRESLLASDMVVSRREIDNSAAAQMAQDYHNGPLSVLIPLGIFGVLALVWFWFAGFRLLLANYRYGTPELQSINTLFLALFITKILHFIFIFGSLHHDFYQFSGILGLSVALNGGMCSKTQPPMVEESHATKGPASLLPHSRTAFRRLRDGGAA
jgi:hypothetical protein